MLGTILGIEDSEELGPQLGKSLGPLLLGKSLGTSRLAWDATRSAIDTSLGR